MTNSEIIKVFQLLFLVLISQILKESVCVKAEEDIEKEYNAYYLEFENLKIVYGKDDISDVPKITLLDVLWPFIQTFWWTFLAITVVLVTILCVCLIQGCDWTTICKPLEYLPCQGHALLSKRLERLKTPGVYVRKDGFKEYYEPIANESDIANDVLDRLQTN